MRHTSPTSDSPRAKRNQRRTALLSTSTVAATPINAAIVNGLQTYSSAFCLRWTATQSPTAASPASTRSAHDPPFTGAAE